MGVTMDTVYILITAMVLHFSLRGNGFGVESATPKCHITCTDGSGFDYAGTLMQTYSNFTCQRWDSNFPHNNILGSTDDDFPCDNSRTAANNYCRAVGGDAKPRCYTTDENVDWDYCIVPLCNPPPACYPSCKIGPADYAGKISVTKSGKTCKRWDVEEFPCDSSRAKAENYCRAPDGDELGPWCFTTDPETEWEYCEIPNCEPGTSKCPTSCKIGSDYGGKIAVTKSGLTCKRWDHEKFPCDSSRAEAKNYCRNPDGGEEGPWCYTTDPETEWEYCDIPNCGSSV